ncbi:MAG: alpha/beta hydrolase [Acidimicrobiia bacterium]|nr:alpha/beta hydrolase [Acidimicrobiia bacterium]
MPYAIDPELEPFLALLPPPELDDLEASRARILGLLEQFNAGVDVTAVAVTDHLAPAPGNAPDVLVRVYAPEGEPTPSGRSGLLSIHGGGFTTGSIEMDHGFCVATVRRLGIVAATVEYRLAPEHPFPAGIEDCYAALCWFHDNAAVLGVDPARIGIGGQSAGGGLTAGTALLARDCGGPPLCFQFLGIPELDHRLDTPSMRAFIDTPMWSRPQAILSWERYLGADHGDVSPYASPSIAPDLAGLPPAYVTTMEFDPLRDEGILYAMRLMQAGVQVELHSYPGTFHGSSLVTTAAVSRRGTDDLFVALRRGLRSQPTG